VSALRESAPLTIAADAPFLAGHFPGAPLVPGVVILQYVVEEIARQLGRQASPRHIRTAKFLAPLRPGEPLTIELEASDATTVQFSCRSGERQIASGVLVLRGG
jgi:3-hydroxymyristoyl/3-hydroxydecanoyl-(acyl carrier protein) dehydratase